MRRWIAALSLLAVSATAVITLHSQTPAASPASSAQAAMTPATRWQRATDAWEAGEYPPALEDLRALMRSPAAGDYLERVALLTGELYSTTELTTDGRNPKISADGQFASYESGPTTAPVTRLVRVGAPPQVVAELPTTAVAFDPTSPRVGWLRGAGANSDIVVRDLRTNAESVFTAPPVVKTGLVWSGDGTSVLFIGADPADASRSDIYAVSATGAARRLSDAPGVKTNLQTGGQTFAYQIAAAGGGRGGGGRGAGQPPAAPPAGPAPAAAPATAPVPTRACGPTGRGGGAAPYSVGSIGGGAPRSLTGSALTLSADGSTAAWLERSADGACAIQLARTDNTPVTTVRVTRDAIDAPALSPDGTLVAYQDMSNTDWDIYVSDTAGSHRRVTRDIQHDLLPRFLDNTTLLGMMGEARHRRSQLYDLATGTRARLFANNTIRTISPEYIWIPSADRKHLIIQAERDGDTVSTERGVYVVDLTKKVTIAEVLARVDRQLAAENDLRQRMSTQFKPIDALVRQVVGRARVNHVYEYEKTLFDFDSKYVSQPGNRKAIQYLERTYRSFGYDPQLQPFTPAQAQGNETANVVSIKRGTENPDLIYVVSSHFDSVVVGPGADDDTSGTAALLETARMLADTPLPATVVFASFTGEEAGLLGSREFVRRAEADKWHIVGALNNDMIGWASESSRMDNTIRYSNAGIKDIQHGAAFLYTNLITYDAKYYKSTDAAAFYDGWGDIVGGIGSYPVLANPNYHQPTDFIETMNFRQIAETAKVTAATLVYLASSPSRLKDLKSARSAGGVEVTWTPSPEKGVARYLVEYGPAADTSKRTRVAATAARIVLPALPAGTEVSVKAVNARGMEGWDWARIVLQ
jgi:hypothetical protein